MNFGSFVFLLIFLPISVIAYFFIDKLNKPLIKNIFIFIISAVFYCWVGIKFFVFIFALASINYLLVILMKHEKYRKTLMISAVVIDVGFLVFFKYLNFLCSIVSIQNDFIASIAAPLGVSFIVFHLITYIVDVYRKDAPIDYNFLNLLVYVFFFPKVIVGPITPYKDMIGQIEDRHTSLDDLTSGIKFFILGLAQKVFIADILLPLVSESFGNSAIIATWIAWVGLITYTIQIYIDFVAYTNMAIGLAKVFGFSLPENFNYPYLATSITDFWRRWHITLGAWFRNYVYIPLGGNRKGKFRTYLNLFIIFLLTGIWHGAAWQFIIWGLLHGAFMLIERAFLGKYLKKIPKVFSVLYTLFIVMLGWVLFNSKDLPSALQYYAALFNFNSSGEAYAYVLPQFDAFYFIALALGILCCFPLLRYVPSKIKDNKIITSVLAFIALAACIVYLSAASFNPFIYYLF